MNFWHLEAVKLLNAKSFQKNEGSVNI